MIIRGKLTLHHVNDNYLMFTKGRLENISDYLYSMFLDKAIVKVKITHIYSGKVLFDAEGELYKERIEPKYYTYFVGNSDLDSVLWDNVGNRIEIDIKNISKD